MNISQNRMKGLILLFFFFSGMTGLVYQIIWMRLISQVIGGAPFAVAAILVVFMGGLGVGSYIAARTIDRFAGLRLVRIYGILELVIGIYALFVPLLLMFFQFPYGLLYNAFYEHTLFYNLFVFLGTFLALGIPTMCMGATLPILCKYSVDNLSRLGSNAGLLYGINTIGAALGALLCGFWMINAMGVWGAMLAAVFVNVAIGLACLAVAPKQLAVAPKGATVAGGAGADAARPGELEDEGLRYSPAVLYCALAIFMVSGFCAMAYEVFWTKLLGLVVGPTTYSFTIVLVTFIVGLALGNLVFGRWADRTRNVPALLIATQAAAALCALLVSQFFGNSQLFFAKLIHTFSGDFGILFLVKALVLFSFMILPTFFLGATFPLVAKIYTGSLATVGRSIGVAYALNTVGAVLGSFCAGFVLIPLVGKETGLSLVTGFQLVTSLAAGIFILGRRREHFHRLAAFAVLLFLGVALCFAYPSWNRQVLATGKYHRFEGAAAVAEIVRSTGWFRAAISGAHILAASERGELVYYGDGIGGFTTVLKYHGPFGEAEYSMANSGKMDASSRGDMKTQTLLAHFPMLFANNPEKVMVLGLASGVTAGEVLHYPVRQLDVIDINDRVFEAARFFDPWNNRVLDDPRTKAIVQDALAHLALTKTTYDVIISEPSNPWMAGQASLFTREFFETARDRLTDDGIYVQWFHCYQMDWDTFALVGRTFADVFPGSFLVSCEPGGLSGDFLFVGFKDGGGLRWDRARKNIDHARKSDNIDLASPELFLRLLVSEDLEALFGPGPMNRENRPLLEYAAPRLMHQDEQSQIELLHRLLDRARLGQDTAGRITALLESVDARIDYAAYALSVYAPFADMVDLRGADESQKARYEAMLIDYSRGNPLDFELVGDADLALRLRGVQIDSIRERLPHMAVKGPAHLYLGWLLSEEGDLQNAVVHYRKGVSLEPGDLQARNDLGYLLYLVGEYEEALSHFRQAVDMRPDFLQGLGNMAYTLIAMESLDEALYFFREVLRLEPNSAEAHYQAGMILEELEKPAEASEHLRWAIRLAPGMAEAHDRLAMLLATRQEVFDPRGSLYYARQAASLTGERDPVVLAGLAVAQDTAGQPAQARKTAAMALEQVQALGNEGKAGLVESRLRHRNLAP